MKNKTWLYKIYTNKEIVPTIGHAFPPHKLKFETGKCKEKKDQVWNP